jgi:ABC-type lipoprotein export system ATPase subunit
MTVERLIRTSGLCRHYHRGRHEVRALDGIDFHVERGEMLAVVGASGSGKSTLLNLLAGLDTPTSGVIEIAGSSLTSMSRRDIAEFRARRIGMIFQSFNLLPHLSACRNVELALYFSDYDKRDRHRRAAAILERLGLSDRMQHVPGELSGGEQQRVAVARALVKEPEILCADEPTGNLDQENTEQIGKILAECNRSGVTVVMATHDLGLASGYCHRSVRLRYGILAEDDSPTPTGEES